MTAAAGPFPDPASNKDFAMRNIHLFTQGLAHYLIQDNLIKPESLQTYWEACERQKIPLITYLVRENILDSEAILSCCTKHFSIPVFNLTTDILQDNFLSPELILRYRVLPLSRDTHNLYIGISDPSDHAALSAIRFHTGVTVSPLLVDEKILDKILSILARQYHFGTEVTKIIPIPETKIEKEDDDEEPVSEFVTRLIDDAILQHASDIHIEPYAKQCRIRFRRDGLLYEVATLPPHFATRLIARLKILAHLNIGERRLPQDGRLPLSHSTLDIRINTCPTLAGEKIVLRLLNSSKIKLEIDALGFLPDQQEIFLEKLSQPQGLILVTGPTGSGKTITLYSALHHLNKIDRNISSVEDPVEMEFTGINQININPRIGLDFATVLRSLLRQDPDIIMIGEIRDTQTAEIAVQAAQTGHLVLSTLHTNSAIETITRLQSMGIMPHHFISAVSLIIAQRLVRKLCVYCKTGCDHCHQGYQGRTGIFECLPITNTLSQNILEGANSTQIQSIMQAQSWISLHEAGMTKIKNGVTNDAEILRVLGKN